MVVLHIATKWSSLQTFVPNGKTISIPEKSFHAIALSVEEDEKRTWEQLSREELLHDGAKTLKTLAHIDRIFA